MQGKGHAEYTNGDVYDGNWEGDVRSGHGTTKCADGELYEGNFQDDTRHGAGTCTYVAAASLNNTIVSCVLCTNRACPRLCSYPSGDRYEGEWVANVREVQAKTFRGLDRTLSSPSSKSLARLK